MSKPTIAALRGMIVAWGLLALPAAFAQQTAAQQANVVSRSHRSVTACLEELRDLDLVATFAEANVFTAGTAGVKLREAGIT